MAWRTIRNLNVWRLIRELDARVEVLEADSLPVSYDMPPHLRVTLPGAPVVDVPVVEPPSVYVIDEDDERRYGIYL